MKLIPPFDQEEQYPVHDLVVDIGGYEYRLLYVYRERQDRWYLTVYDADGVALAHARKLRHGVVMFGRLMCIDLHGDEPPGYEDLGRRHRIVFFEDADIPVAADDPTITIEVTP